MSADVHQFARFVRTYWPEVNTVSQVTPEMAQAYINELVRRECSGGRIGRVCASIRKLDTACRATSIFPLDAPALLPYQAETGLGGFHSQPRPMPYPMHDAQRIVTFIEKDDPLIARLLRLMITSGLRIREACYLRAQDIDLEHGIIQLNVKDNVNRTKGGRPRQVFYPSESQDFIGELKSIGNKSPTGHIFPDRGSLPNRARARVRAACQMLNIPSLGTHGFRKTFAVKDYEVALKKGESDRHALLATSRQLGHNRSAVTRQSYIPPEVRK